MNSGTKRSTKKDIGFFTSIDWLAVAGEMHERGYSHLERILPAEHCDEFIAAYDRQDIYRKTVTMERHRFGLGEYKYFSYPLPEVIQNVREQVYPNLAPIANTWAEQLKLDTRFPAGF